MIPARVVWVSRDTGRLDAKLDEIAQDLQRQETSPRTRDAYRLDLLHFAGWFAQSVGEALSPAAVTPTDVREYRGYLITVEKRQPATVNRRLASARLIARPAP